MVPIVPRRRPYYRPGMLKIVPLCIAVVGLSGCVSWVGRLPGTTDSQCMRAMLAHGAGNAGPLDFTQAASRCVQFEHSVTAGDNPAYAPLDVRDDPELQRMAEDPAENYGGYAFVPRQSTAPKTGARWNIVH